MKAQKVVTKAELLKQVDDLTMQLNSKAAEIGSLRAMVSECLGMTRELLRLEVAQSAKDQNQSKRRSR